MANPYNYGSGSNQSPRRNRNHEIPWPIIIVLFALGAWPFALALLFLNLFSDQKQTKSNNAQRRDSAQAQMDDMVRQVMERVETQQNQTARKSAAQEAMDRARAAQAAAQPRSQAQTFADPAASAQRIARQTADRRAARERAAQAAAQQAAAQAAQLRRDTEHAAAQKAHKEKKHPGRLLRWFGIALLVIGSMMMGLDFLPNMFQYGMVDYETFFAGLVFLAGGGVLWGRGNFLANMGRRSQRYLAAIGNARSMSLSEIAKRVNRSEAKAARELQKLIDKGYMGSDAYIDRERGYFLRYGATVEEPEEEVVPPEAEEGYSGVLRNIRRANDRIADPVLSQKIDRIEQVTALIFKEVEEHPEKRSTIRTFFDYYLPTTQKLLDAYADFEETGVEGENLREAKGRIEQTMDAIVEGFEQQLDQLYSADAMDVVSDIQVMETMLHRDTGSAAKDFGFPPAQEGQDAGTEPPQQLQI